MGRKTKQNKITSPELIAQINPKNIRLMNDFLDYLRSVGKAESTVKAYTSDLYIFFVWVLQNADNKYFPEVSKRDIVSYQNWLLRSNENSPARVRRLKSMLSSMSNYIEAILDDELPNFRSIIRKIENPVNAPAREKTVLSDEQADRYYYVSITRNPLAALARRGMLVLQVSPALGSFCPFLPSVKVSQQANNLILQSFFRTVALAVVGVLGRFRLRVWDLFSPHKRENKIVGCNYNYNRMFWVIFNDFAQEQQKPAYHYKCYPSNGLILN